MTIDRDRARVGNQQVGDEGPTIELPLDVLVKLEGKPLGSLARAIETSGRVYDPHRSLTRTFWSLVGFFDSPDVRIEFEADVFESMSAKGDMAWV